MKRAIAVLLFLIIPVMFQSNIIAANFLHVSGHYGNDIQEAIDNLENGGTVILDEGEYKITKALLLNDGISIVGKGKKKTILVLENNANCHIITNENHKKGNKNIFLKGLTLDGNMSHQNRKGECKKLSICGAYFLKSKNVCVIDVEANNIYETGIHFTSCAYIVVDDFSSETVGMSGIGCSGSNDVVIISSVVYNSGLDVRHSAIHIDGGVNIFIEAEVRKCTGNGIMVNSGFAEGRNVFVKGKSEECLRGVAILGSRIRKPLSSVYVTGEFSNNKIGILLISADDITIKGCLVDNNKTGICIKGKSIVNNNIVYDNIFKGNRVNIRRTK